MQEVVDGGHLIVFVFIEAFRSIVIFKSKLLQVLEHGWLNRDFILTNN
jgi:hypothetical protein